jgi:hypothetical protein
MEVGTDWSAVRRRAVRAKEVLFTLDELGFGRRYLHADATAALEPAADNYSASLPSGIALSCRGGAQLRKSPIMV